MHEKSSPRIVFFFLKVISNGLHGISTFALGCLPWEQASTTERLVVPKRLGEMAFPDTGRADEEDVASFFDVVSGG